ncbi:acylphosphatase [Virgibacillus profundi]|uniref:Acylphosphatase n=1 Tax=Virgibacillus profundi TaxID=2024555 RepID=A0A2A2IDI5_9BACI|nr:acylphosphatase [Virgibacillus profundi]PAV29438.1 acylphosphatase [Virgibacillus profundi]PXY53607.1 acylphosphatase [Virgibacillus profundi]
MNKHLTISGRVQGVGFRYTAQMKAKEHHLVGWVRNKMDGTVEMEVEGTKQQLDSFLNELKSGLNRFIQVENIEEFISDEDKGYNNFSIK